jgi:Ca-activated chloride channel family protein
MLAAPEAAAPAAPKAEYDGSAKLFYSQDTYYPQMEEEYLSITENAPKSTQGNPLQTFSLKVDTSSYSNVSRYINSGNLPPADAVKMEEMINYFQYESEPKWTDSPFGIYTEIGPSPFDINQKLAFVRVKARDIDRSKLPNANLTFLIDTSGSMDSYDKLPLLQASFEMLINNLSNDDIVSIVTYAGNSAVVLDSVSGGQKDRLYSAIYNLEAGGGTAGADGILTAYALAEKNYRPNRNNRVILATDGDFNVGVSSVDELERLISAKRDSGVYLSVLGFGTENLKDNKMETLAKNGNGNYSYIDSVPAAHKVLVDELASNLYAIADDVKAQVEFNPGLVSSYRLIGYENRQLANRDFADDTKDAGEIGVGTDVVVLFEIELAGQEPGLKYQTPAPSATDNRDAFRDELFEVRIRYKNPGESESKLIVEPVKTERILEKNSSDFNFASAVAGFGHLLRGSQYKGSVSAEQVRSLAESAVGRDEKGYRNEFLGLLRGYTQLAGGSR